MYRLNYHSLLHELEQQKISIQNQFNCGILDSIDATNELMMIRKKEFDENMIKKIRSI